MAENTSRLKSKKSSGEDRFKKDSKESDLMERNISFRRVVKVIPGGRRFMLSGAMVVGDGAGRIGYGTGKGKEMVDACKKARKEAQRKMKSYTITGNTIPYPIIGRFASSRVVLKPAPPGTGLRTSAVVRSVVELVGIKDLTAKCLGSVNFNNVALATLDALSQIQDIEKVLLRRKGGKKK